MSHCIEEHDVGYIAANSTWHNKPQFICLGEGNYPTLEQAREVFDYPIEKQPVFRNRKRLIPVPEIDAEQSDFVEEVPGNYCLVRTDHDVVLAPHVGNRYVADSNMVFLQHIERWVMQEFPDAKIDSVGTLKNGATAFLNIRFKEFQVKGDQSNTIANILFYNPLGDGCIRTCGNSVRVVCNNTANFALKSGVGTQKYRHVRGVGQKVAQGMVDIAEAHLGLQRYTEQMEALASMPVTQEYFEQFIAAQWQLPAEPSKRTLSIAENRVNTIQSIFEGGQHMERAVGTSRYGLFQAVTDYVDHNGNTEHTFDNITGNRADVKQQALQYLLV